MKQYSNNAYLIIFETVRFVRGYTKSTICDIERRKNIIVPNSVYDFYRRNNKKLIGKIRAYYQDDETVNEYIDFLVEKEFAFVGSYHDVLHFKPMGSVSKSYPQNATSFSLINFCN